MKMKYGYAVVGLVAGGVTYVVIPPTVDQTTRVLASSAVAFSVGAALYWYAFH